MFSLFSPCYDHRGTGWFAFLVVLDCFVIWFFFLSRVLSSLALFTFLILSLDLGVTCAFLDTNGLCDDLMRFLSFLPCDSGLFIVFYLRFFMGGKQGGSAFASTHLFFNTLYPASIIMRGSNFFYSQHYRFVYLSPAFYHCPPSACLFILCWSLTITLCFPSGLCKQGGTVWC